MTMDFAQLYLQLGIRDDCTLEEFKHACRRRIRQQHPDRMEDRGSQNETQVALAELLALYAKALRFHRRHGRLPGAVAPAALAPTTGSGLRPTDSSPALAIRSYPPKVSSPPTPRSISLRNPALVLAATIAALTAFNAWNESEGTVEAAQATAATLPASTETAALPAEAAPPPQDTAAVQPDGQPLMAPPRLIEIGMDAETVRALQGDPMQSEGSEWTYGPSWIRFERDRVIDWYSSPLHRLKTETTSP